MTKTTMLLKRITRCVTSETDRQPNRQKPENITFPENEEKGLHSPGNEVGAMDELTLSEGRGGCLMPFGLNDGPTLVMVMITQR